MRADLRIARKLGITLRRFHGDDPKPGEPEFDDWERAHWRAFEIWEADTCSGCGGQLSDTLHDENREHQPVFDGAFVECLKCKAIELAQDAQRRSDAKKQASLDEKFKDNPQQAPRLPSSHRKWFGRSREDVTDE